MEIEIEEALCLARKIATRVSNIAVLRLKSVNGLNDFDVMLDHISRSSDIIGYPCALLARHLILDRVQTRLNRDEKPEEFVSPDFDVCERKKVNSLIAVLTSLPGCEDYGQALSHVNFCSQPTKLVNDIDEAKNVHIKILRKQKEVLYRVSKATSLPLIQKDTGDVIFNKLNIERLENAIADFDKRCDSEIANFRERISQKSEKLLGGSQHFAFRKRQKWKQLESDTNYASLQKLILYAMTQSIFTFGYHGQSSFVELDRNLVWKNSGMSVLHKQSFKEKIDTAWCATLFTGSSSSVGLLGGVMSCKVLPVAALASAPSLVVAFPAILLGVTGFVVWDKVRKKTDYSHTKFMNVLDDDLQKIKEQAKLHFKNAAKEFIFSLSTRDAVQDEYALIDRQISIVQMIQ